VVLGPAEAERLLVYDGDIEDSEVHWMSRPLKVGVQLPEVERFVTWLEVRDMATTAEDVGFDSLWVGDHLLYRTSGRTTGPWEAWSMLAAIAAVTDRVQIGPLVAATSFHSPAMLAKKAVTVDEVSGGRLILGLGAGWNQDEYDAYGFPFDHRASRFEEAFTIIRTLLTVGAIDFEGAFYTLRECELVPPARSGGIPLMIGSEGPRVLRATLPFVDGWNAWHAWYDNSIEGAAVLLARIDDACAEAERVPSTLDRSLAVLVRAPGGSSGARQGSPNRKSSVALGDDEEMIAEHLVGLASLGVNHVQLVVDPITAESIEWLGGVLAVLDNN
jgi:alkanesulfonate monooxygenase SsuD/methylene tetrahydromethanopterin reductase-like flavin-dependent oxidoreductase (luciferase family)